MLKPVASAPLPEVARLSELHPLMAQLGSADGLLSLSSGAAALRLPRVRHQAGLRLFLQCYMERILLPLELPAICRAFHHARRGETRELVALDRTLARGTLPPELAAASRRVGRSQLQRLRPLRTERIVQRYLQAVTNHRAHGWHTLVFGLTLAVYSIPVRQGLLAYTRQTLRGFIQTAARPLRQTRAECRDLLENLCAHLPRQLDAIVAHHARTRTDPW
ncbi:MAG: hypothetical protein JXQ71_05200 [Verrucomicrobia bacterium]|nr:hypothetical protein [Verrucomicrobiota bacterium]